MAPVNPTPAAAAADEVPLQPETAGRPAARRTTGLLSVAAVVLAAVGIAAWSASRPNGSALTAAGRLPGTDWLLVGYGDQTTPAHQAPQGVRLRIADGRILGDDGCNTFSGPVDVGQGTLRLHDLATTAVGCPDELPLYEYFDGIVSWSITGDTLTITKDGVGTLTYRAPRPGSPDDLVNRTWILERVLSRTGDVGRAGYRPLPPTTIANVAPVPESTLFITANGSLTADVRCGEFTARVALTAAEMTVSDRSFTEHRCPLPAPGLRADDARIEGALRTLLSGTVPWTIDGNVLTIGPAKGAVLHYEAVKSEPAPSPTNTPNPSNTVIPPVTATASLVGSASAGRAIPRRHRNPPILRTASRALPKGRTH